MKRTAVSLLLVEDDERHAGHLTRELGRAGAIRFHIDHCTRLDDALVRLEAGRYDLIVSDLYLPDYEGLPTLVHLREAHPDIPIVVLSEDEDAPTALLALKNGAQDFLIKQRTDRERMTRAVAYAIERHRIDKRLRDQTQELHAFTYAVTHDLRTPLITMDFLIEEAREHLEADDRLGAGEALDALSMRVGTMERLVKDLHALACIEASDPNEVVRLDTLVLGVVLDLQHDIEARGIDIRLDLGHVPRLHANPAQLRQLMTNLIGNAVKYTRDNGGTVRIAASPCRRGDQTAWRIEVADNGPGVAEEDRERIFRIFERGQDPLDRHIHGTGVGLALAAKVARHMDTWIHVRDAPEGGALFTFEIPPERIIAGATGGDARPASSTSAADAS